MRIKLEYLTFLIHIFNSKLNIFIQLHKVILNTIFYEFPSNTGQSTPIPHFELFSH